MCTLIEISEYLYCTYALRSNEMDGCGYGYNGWALSRSSHLRDIICNENKTSCFELLLFLSHQPAMPQKRLLYLLVFLALGVFASILPASMLLVDVVELSRFWRAA